MMIPLLQELGNVPPLRKTCGTSSALTGQQESTGQRGFSSAPNTEKLHSENPITHTNTGTTSTLCQTSCLKILFTASAIITLPCAYPSFVSTLRKWFSGEHGDGAEFKVGLDNLKGLLQP